MIHGRGSHFNSYKTLSKTCWGAIRKSEWNNRSVNNLSWQISHMGKNKHFLKSLWNIFLLYNLFYLSGKSTVACSLSRELYALGKISYVLDGDNLRHGLNKDLGFKAEDRAENIRRVGKYVTFWSSNWNRLEYSLGSLFHVRWTWKQHPKYI